MIVGLDFNIFFLIVYVFIYNAGSNTGDGVEYFLGCDFSIELKFLYYLLLFIFELILLFI